MGIGRLLRSQHPGGVGLLLRSQPLAVRAPVRGSPPVGVLIVGPDVCVALCLQEGFELLGPQI